MKTSEKTMLLRYMGEKGKHKGLVRGRVYKVDVKSHDYGILEIIKSFFTKKRLYWMSITVKVGFTKRTIKYEYREFFYSEWRHEKNKFFSFNR